MERAKCYLIISILYSVSYLNSYSQSFTDIGAVLTGSVYGSCAWGDYDNDGDLDVIIAGSSNTRLYRNDGATGFTFVNTGLPALEMGTISWADYDNDGDLDIAITGDSGGSKITRIYRNDGGTVFIDINAGLIGLSWSTLAWGDYDNDGKPDLLVTGLGQGEEPTARLYHNDGNGVFSDSKISITPCVMGMVKWGDYNNDGFLDILILGQDFNGNSNTEIYRNDGKNNFLGINANFRDGFRGGVDWGDYDNDGYLDVLIGGQISGTNIYHNNGNNSFTNINAGLPALSYCSTGWGDYDNDGDLDVIISGVNPGNGISYTQLFQNKGNNIFTEDANTLIDVSTGALAWGDYDSDGDLDLVITGSYGNTPISKIYRNDTPSLNSAPSVPTGIQSTVINNGAVLKWNPSTDSKTLSPGLTYNVRIGTSAAGIDILSPMSNLTSGYKKIPTIGNAMQNTNYIIKYLPVGTYFWSVQAVDPCFKASPFSVTGSFNILPTLTDMGVNMLAVENSASAWGDYDNDGSLDLLLIGNDPASAKNISKIYHNNGTGVFDTINANLVGVSYGTCAWGDYDNDGDLDILIAGNTRNIPDYKPVSKIYRNNGNNTFTDINAGLTGVGFSSSAWGDYDNDGDLDILLSGVGLSSIYRNDGDGIFVDIHANFIQSNQGTAGWGDFDNDKDLDAMICGNSKTEIYRNNGSDTFTSLELNLSGTVEGSSVWGDYDNDGDLDILFTGSANGYNSVKILHNNGNGTFTDINAGFRGVSESSGIWGDFNNDGYSDVFYSGRSGSFISKIYLNNRNGTYTDIYAQLLADYRSKISTADFDNDGDLDFFITRYGQKPVLYRNNMNFPNDPPGAPSNLRIENVGFGVNLSWDRATDKQSNNGGLYYNFRLGKTTQSLGIVSPMTTQLPGYKRTIPAIGNAQMKTSWRNDSLPVGTYYWSVQAIDQSFTGGAWATEQSFLVTQLRPFFSNDTVCFGDSTTFKDQTITTGTKIASWNWDFGDGGISTLQNPKHIYITAGIFSVKLEVTDTSGSKMTRINSIIVLPRPQADFSVTNICIGDMASVVNISNTDTLAISSWAWTYGDGTVSSLKYPGPHGYLNTGSYDISLTVAAKNGCESSKILPIIVAEYPAAIISASGNPEFCEGGSIKLSVPYNRNYSYQWKVGNAPVSQADSSVYVANYTGSFTTNITNKIAGCISESVNPVSVKVAGSPLQPLIITEGNTTFCQGDSILLSVTNISEYIYQWKLNGGAVGSNSNKFTARNAGTYNLVVSNTNGCSATSPNSLNVVVNGLPSSSAVSLSGSTTFCSGGNLTLTIPSTSGYSYNWRNETGLITGASTNSFMPNKSGNYQVDISNSSGCIIRTQPVIVLVKPMPIKPVIDPGNYQPGKCMGENPIRLNVSQAVNEYNYQWYKNGIPVSNATSSYYEAFLSQGDYSLEADLSGCKVQSDLLNVYFENAPEKPLIYAEGSNIWYLACSNDSASQYKWYFNGALIQGADKYIYVANRKLGKYNVSIANTKGCFTISDAITIPTGTTGIEDIDPFAGLKIYPNPTPGLFTIEMENQLFGDLLINILTHDGKNILRIKFEKTTIHFSSQIDLSGQSKGMYLINLLLDKYLANRKIVVE